MIALKEGVNAYLKYPNASAENLIDVSLRFKTQVQSGIILLTTTRDGSDPFSLFLLNGELVSRTPINQFVFNYPLCFNLFCYF